MQRRLLWRLLITSVRDSKSSTNKKTPTKFRGVLIAWSLLAILHFTLYSSVGIARLTTHTYREFEAVFLAIHGQSTSQRPPNARDPYTRMSWYGPIIPYIESIQEESSKIVSLPLLVYLDGPTRANAGYYEISIPLSLRLLNSTLAGALILLFGNLVTRNLPDKSVWRRFFGGYAALESGQLPQPFEQMPLVKSARFMKAAERDAVKRVIVFGVLHYVACYALRMLELSESVGGYSGIWTTLAAILRFPLSPLIVPDYNQALQNANEARMLGLLSILNSLFWAVILGAVIRFFRFVISR